MLLHIKMVKHIATYFVMSLYFFFSGVEYAVILPTLNLYLLSFNAASYYIGLVLSAFSFGGLLSAPVYGHFTDKTGSSKYSVMFSNLFEIAGNILYLVASSPVMILLSRFLAGLGSGSASSIFGMIARSTNEKQRTAAFSLLMSLRQIGLLVGPGFNLFLNDIDFYIGSLHVTSFQAPGLFMAILWVLHEILLGFFYTDIPSYESTGADSEVATNTEEIDSMQQNGGINDPCVDPLDDPQVMNFWKLVKYDLLKEEVVICLFVSFAMMFLQSGLETLITPLTLQLFQWQEISNSIYFCVAGGVIIIGFLVVGALSKKVSDRRLLLIGSLVMTALYVYFLVYIIFATKNLIEQKLLFALFAIHSTLLLFDIPFIWVPQASLFSKVTSKRSQAFNQGVRMVTMRIGQIMGPLWAASFLNNLPIMISVNLFLMALLSVMVIASYKRLVPREKRFHIYRSSENGADEKTPLLREES